MISSIGVIGGGQLGRMFALDAKRMGYHVVTLDPQEHSPCGQVADEQIVARYEDLDAIDRLGKMTDIVTYEFENIAIESVRYLEQHGYHVTPSSEVLRITQDRLLEKRFVRECGVGTADFEEIANVDDIATAAERIGFPAVIKTTRGGYDGKGQWRVTSVEQAHEAWSQAKGATLILERFVPFLCEVSVVATRNAAGDVVTYPTVENIHDSGILSMTIVPARVSPDIA
ncbi:MAG TPA: ATP-grasp domain-containing protein, partial [Candidatus Aquilonibacter sp.]|nr:ATP-grasp domain-containing protein [Candidatus Aquilonibacter sp.]